MIRVALADDHPVVRAGVVSVLEFRRVLFRSIGRAHV